MALRIHAELIDWGAIAGEFKTRDGKVALKDAMKSFGENKYDDRFKAAPGFFNKPRRRLYTERKLKSRGHTKPLVFYGNLWRYTKQNLKFSVRSYGAVGTFQGQIGITPPKDEYFEGKIKRYTQADIVRLSALAKTTKDASKRARYEELLKAAIVSVQRIDIRAEIRQMRREDLEFIAAEAANRYKDIVNRGMRKYRKSYFYTAGTY